MNDPVKILSLEAENVKRVRAVKVEPTAAGLTIIGGDNNQGKTSVLDALAWALGGDRFRPSQAAREGSAVPPYLKVTLSDGIIVERKGKNSALTVTDPSGKKAGQQLLNAFIEPLALDLPRFMQMNDREKADTLLQIIGVGDQLVVLEHKEQELYNKRHAIGQIADQKAKYAKEQAFWPDAPKDLISASDLIAQQQDILARNGENQRKRAMVEIIARQVETLQAKVSDLALQLNTAQEELAAKSADLETARKSAEQLHDESTEELERSIRDIETINAKVRDNLNREKAEEDARGYREQYDALTAELEKTRQAKRDLLDGAHLPLPGLGVEDGALTYQGQRWDNMSGSDQLRVATAIVRCLKPQCGFVLLDKLEQMDLTTLREFGAWLESEGLQALATRVSTGGECSIIIEDGYVQGAERPVPAEPKQNTWKSGEF
ncbi:AAA family ATPase [Agathobaculum sp.]|uniref:AAA family ATPase n=1 Tax=Agathobaculum sp. TaxID=2048138 RepID=UPI00399FDE4F